ncbi:MAG: MFS transporter, partial [Planctomycetota bacterium]|nr:MFS transporter [Planctomycetota bacterium]
MDSIASPRRTGFLGHLIGQATGAANDNLFRQAFAFALTAAVVSEIDGNRLKAAMGLLFIVPFVVLAPLAGHLADTMPKDRLVRRLRFLELGLCLSGCIALLTGSVVAMLVTVAALGAQSALFAPVKYAILPEIVSPDRLDQANGRIQALSNVAILTGTALAITADGSALPGWGGAWTVGAVSMLLALCGIAGALSIPRLTAQATSTGCGSPLAALGILRRHPELRVPMFSLSAVWAIGAVIQLVLTGVAVHSYHLTEAGAALLALSLGLGLAAGALLAPLLQHRAYPAGLPVAGAVLSGGGAIATGLLAAAGAPLGWTISCIVVAGLGGGLWIVPLTVLLQRLAPDSERGRVFA